MGELGSLSIKFGVYQGSETCIILTEPTVENLSNILDSIKTNFHIGNDLTNKIVDEVIDIDGAKSKLSYSPKTKESEKSISEEKKETTQTTLILTEDIIDPLEVAAGSLIKSESQEFENSEQQIETLTKIGCFTFINYKCLFCDLQFPIEVELTEHFYMKHDALNVQTSEGSFEYNCRSCGKKFSRYPAAVRHCRVRSSYSYQCPDCRKNIAHPGNVERHRKRCTGKETFFCSKCTKIVKYKVNYDKHIETCQVKRQHKHVKDAPIEEGQSYIYCKVCDYKSVYSSVVKKHMTLLHNDEKNNYKCSFCERNFHSNSGVRKHKSLVHSQISFPMRVV